MARIPTISSQISALSGGSNAGVPSPRATPDAFGGATGRALQMVGGALDQSSDMLMQIQDRRRQETVANMVAQSDYTTRELTLRSQAPASGEGYTETVNKDYAEWVTEQANNIEDPVARKDFKDRMMAEGRSVSSRSATYEFTAGAEHSQNEANASLTALDNKIRISPDQYDSFIEQGRAVIDTRTDIPAGQREQMKTAWAQDAARARFDGLLDAANTPEDLDAIEIELRNPDGEGRDWTKELAPQKLDGLLAVIGTAKSTMRTKADADARAVLDTLEGRAGEANTLIPRDELAAAQSVVSQSQNPVTMSRMARIVRDQEIVQQTRGLTPGQQREQMVTRGGTGLPAVVNTAIDNAAATFGIPASYLASTVTREYGMYLKGDEGAIDYGKANADGASSATGVMQFIEGTFLETIKTAGVAAAAGIDIAGMSDAEISALRKDPKAAIMVGAAFTMINKRYFESAMGRAATEGDLYVAHFMGKGGAVRLAKMAEIKPDVAAADMFAAQAKANPTIFYKDGKARSVQEVYNQLTSRHGGTTAVQFADNSTRQNILDATEKGIKDDVMSFAEQAGVFTFTGLDQDGGFTARGQEAKAVADYYNIPAADMTPFKKDEAAAIAKSMAEGTADEVLKAVSAIQSMGGDVARAALKQVGQDQPAYAYAGRLQLETGQNSVAGDIIRGQKRIEENPDIKNSIGASPSEISAGFYAATGTSLDGINPRERQDVLEAATAHYVETVTARGGGGAFDPERFADSVQAVMGGTADAPALDEVNGRKAILPPGISGAEMEDAMRGMTVADWSSMSRDGTPPRYIDGGVADPLDISDEATLEAIGGGGYRVALGDGSMLVTGEQTDNGRVKAFVFMPDVKRLHNINKSSQDAVKAQDAQFQEEYENPTALNPGMATDPLIQDLNSSFKQSLE